MEVKLSPKLTEILAKVQKAAPKVNAAIEEILARVIDGKITADDFVAIALALVTLAKALKNPQ